MNNGPENPTFLQKIGDYTFGQKGSDLVQRFNLWYGRNISTERGWPGDLISTGVVPGTVLTLGFEKFADPLNEAIQLSSKPPYEFMPVMMAEATFLWIIASGSGFLAKRAVDRVLPQSWSQKSSLNEVLYRISVRAHRAGLI